MSDKMKMIIKIKDRKNPEKWWHRPIIWIQGKLAPSYVLVIPNDNGGVIYTRDVEKTEANAELVLHEARHCARARGAWKSWCLMYLTDPDSRFFEEAMAYATGYSYMDVDDLYEFMQTQEDVYWFKASRLLTGLAMAESRREEMPEFEVVT